MTIEKIISEAKGYSNDLIVMLKMEDRNTDTEKIKVAVDATERLAKYCENVTTHQLRNIFKLVKEAGNARSLHAIRPKLAYIGARQSEERGKVLIKVLDELIKEIDKVKDTPDEPSRIKDFHYIMESIVAFHKFYAKK